MSTASQSTTTMQLPFLIILALLCSFSKAQFNLNWLSGSIDETQWGSNDGEAQLTRFKSIQPPGLAVLYKANGERSEYAVLNDPGNFNVREISVLTGFSSTLAGNSALPAATVDGVGKAARFYWNQIMCYDRDNVTNIYINQDHGKTYRYVNTATAAVSTLHITNDDLFPQCCPITCIVGRNAALNYAAGPNNIVYVVYPNIIYALSAAPAATAWTLSIYLNQSLVNLGAQFYGFRNIQFDYLSSSLYISVYNSAPSPASQNSFALYKASLNDLNSFQKLGENLAGNLIDSTFDSINKILYFTYSQGAWGRENYLLAQVNVTSADLTVLNFCNSSLIKIRPSSVDYFALNSTHNRILLASYMSIWYLDTALPSSAANSQPNSGSENPPEKQKANHLALEIAVPIILVVVAVILIAAVIRRRNGRFAAAEFSRSQQSVQLLPTDTVDS
jgi:hypothetical protein